MKGLIKKFQIPIWSVIITAITMHILKSYINELFQKNIIYQFFLIIGLYIVIFILVQSFIKIIIKIKSGLYNLKTCGDKVFDNIDKYKHCLRENNSNYLKCIQIINLYYKEDGEVDKIINKKEIESLFRRMDYLSKQKNFFNDSNVYLGSLAISILASFMWEVLGIKEPILMLICMPILIGVFFSILLFKYSERGEGGSYKYLLAEYETKLLEEKIEMLGEMINITDDEEMMLYTPLS